MLVPTLGPWQWPNQVHTDTLTGNDNHFSFYHWASLGSTLCMPLADITGPTVMHDILPDGRPIEMLEQILGRLLLPPMPERIMG